MIFQTDPLMRVVITKEGDKFVGQVLEHDICSQGATIDQLMDRLGLTIELERQERGGTLADIAPAPDEFHKIWEEARACNTAVTVL